MTIETKVLHALAQTDRLCDDCLSVATAVRPQQAINGTVVRQTKQTRNWSNPWIPKLKDDQQAVGAELAVLVTSAMPRDPSGKSGEPFFREATSGSPASSPPGPSPRPCARPSSRCTNCALP
jgi:hypothetical protein